MLLPDRTTITAEGQDLSHIEVRLEDAQGVLGPDADRLIRFELEGTGTILGVDNGDLRSSEPYQANQRTTYWGRCLAIIQAAREPGEIRLTAAAADLPPAQLLIRTTPSPGQSPSGPSSA